MMSAYIAPQALNAPAVLAGGPASTSSRAMGMMFRPEAPPPATIVTFSRSYALGERDLAEGADDVLGGDEHDGRGCLFPTTPAGGDSRLHCYA